MNILKDMLCIGEVDRFIEGFQLGARFMPDALVLPRQSMIRDID